MRERDLPFLEEEVTLVLVNNGENETGDLLNVLDKVGQELVSLGLYNSYEVKQTEIKSHQIFHISYLGLSSGLERRYTGSNVVALLNGVLTHVERFSNSDIGTIMQIIGCGDKIPIGSITGAREVIGGDDFEAASYILLHEIFEHYYAFRKRRGEHFEDHEGDACALSHKTRGPKICSKCVEWLKGQKKRLY